MGGKSSSYESPLSSIRTGSSSQLYLYCAGRLNPLQLPLDVKHFLYPAETDEGMVETYLSCLAAGTVRFVVVGPVYVVCVYVCRKKWSPLLYLVAIHHVQSFAKERETLHRSILQIKDEVTVTSHCTTFSEQTILFFRK